MKAVAILVAIMLLASAFGGLTYSSGHRAPTPTLAAGAPTQRPAGLVEPLDPNAPPASSITVNSPVGRGQTLVVTVHAKQLAVCTIGWGAATAEHGQGQQTKLADEQGVVTFSMEMPSNADLDPLTGSVTVQCDGSHLATATVVVN